MTKTTFGQIKIRQPFSTISERKSFVYPNGIKQDFIKRSKNTATDDVFIHQIHRFEPNDVVWID